MLVFQCFLKLNHNVEQLAPQVISYQMGWGDTFKSHNYAQLHWSTFVHHLIEEYPELKSSRCVGFKCIQIVTILTGISSVLVKRMNEGQNGSGCRNTKSGRERGV